MRTREFRNSPRHSNHSHKSVSPLPILTPNFGVGLSGISMGGVPFDTGGWIKNLGLGVGPIFGNSKSYVTNRHCTRLTEAAEDVSFPTQDTPSLCTNRPGKKYVSVIRMMARNVVFFGCASGSALRTSVVNTSAR